MSRSRSGGCGVGGGGREEDRASSRLDIKSEHNASTSVRLAGLASLAFCFKRTPITLALGVLRTPSGWTSLSMCFRSWRSNFLKLSLRASGDALFLPARSKELVGLSSWSWLSCGVWVLTLTAGAVRQDAGAGGVDVWRSRTATAAATRVPPPPRPPPDSSRMPLYF